MSKYTQGLEEAIADAKLRQPYDIWSINGVNKAEPCAATAGTTRPPFLLATWEDASLLMALIDGLAMCLPKGFVWPPALRKAYDKAPRILGAAEIHDSPEGLR